LTIWRSTATIASPRVSLSLKRACRNFFYTFVLNFPQPDNLLFR